MVSKYGLTPQVSPDRRMQSMLPRGRDWAKEYDGWREAELDDEPIVYIWADGVRSGLGAKMTSSAPL
jgi:hypothetical protein